MKKELFLSVLFSAIMILTGSTLAKAQINDINDLFMSSFITDEATCVSQELQIPRSSLSNPVSLRKQIDLVVGKLNITGATIVQSYMGGDIEYRKCEDINALLDMDPVFLSFNMGEGKLNRKQFEINTSIYFTYLDGNGKEGSLIIHMRPRGFLDSVIYTRTTIILPSSTEDDLRSFGSRSAAISFSYLAVYEVRDLSKEKEEFMKILESTLAKSSNGQKLDDKETYCIKGYRGHDELGGYIGYGDWLYGNSRYYDAYINFQPAYDILKSFMRPDATELKDLFYPISHKIGASLWKLGHYDLAEYYLRVASYGAEEFKADYSEFLKSRSYDVEEFSGSGLYLGQVLPILFDMDKYCIMQGVSQIKGKSTRYSTSESLWNFDLKSMCTPTPGHLTISLTRTHTQKDGYKGEDQSILCFDNNIIITSHQVNDDLWRIDAVVPNYKNFDQKKLDDDGLNRPTAVSFIIGKNLNNVTVLKLEPSYDSLDKKYNYGVELLKEYRVMESLITLMSVYQQASKISAGGESAGMWDDLVASVQYHLGFCYSELQQPLKALPYLEKASKMKDDSAIKAEYIAILSNIVDPQAFSIIETELSKKPKDKYYTNVLNRRYVYMLIEYGRFDEAEAILNELAKDPANIQFVEQELGYIRMMKGNR